MTVPAPAASTAAVSAKDVASLAAAIAGTAWMPGDEPYDRECAAYNLARPRQPAVVVGAARPEDVSAAVRFAGERGLPVGVIATGHTAAVPADGAVLVSTRRMSGVTIDPAARIARAGAGARWQQVTDAAAPYWLCPPSGSSPLVGVAGYCLGGGLSPTVGRTHGWAADRVRAIELVTADGSMVRATPWRDRDLFWAARGGKDNFGIATAIEFDLFAIRRLYGGGLYFPGEMASEVLHFYRTWAPGLPLDMTASVALLSLPPLDIVPAPLRGRLTVHVRIAYLGPTAAGKQLVAPLRRLGPALIDTVGDMPSADSGRIHADPPVPLPIHEGSMRLAELPGPAVDAILRTAGPGSGGPLAMVELRPLGGALAAEPDVPSAVHRGGAFQLFCAGIGGPEAEADCYRAIDQLVAGLAPWKAGGAALNYLPVRGTGPQAVREAFGPGTYDWLTRIKRETDPANLFRVNHNIPPAP